jgi:hypothetical protein
VTLSPRVIVALILAALLVLAGVAVGSAVYGPKLFKARQQVETRDDRLEAHEQAAVAQAPVAKAAEDLRITVDQGQAQVIYLKERAHAEQDDDGPLPAGRLGRLLEHDADLCRASPESCAGGGGPAGDGGADR